MNRNFFAILSLAVVIFVSSTACAKITVIVESQNLKIIYETDLLEGGQPREPCPYFGVVVSNVVQELSGRAYEPSFDEKPSVSEQRWTSTPGERPHYTLTIEFFHFFRHENVRGIPTEQWVTHIEEAFHRQAVRNVAQI